MARYNAFWSRLPCCTCFGWYHKNTSWGNVHNSASNIHFLNILFKVLFKWWINIVDVLSYDISVQCRNLFFKFWWARKKSKNHCYVINVFFYFSFSMNSLNSIQYSLLLNNISCYVVEMYPNESSPFSYCTKHTATFL